MTIVRKNMSASSVESPKELIQTIISVSGNFIICAN